MIITQATLADAEGVRALLKANHVNYIAEEDKKDGFVTTNLTDEQLEALIVKFADVCVEFLGHGLAGVSHVQRDAGLQEPETVQPGMNPQRAPARIAQTSIAVYRTALGTLPP